MSNFDRISASSFLLNLPIFSTLRCAMVKSPISFLSRRLNLGEMLGGRVHPVLTGGGGGFFFTGGFWFLFFNSCFLGVQSELEFVLETRVRLTFFWAPEGLGVGSWELSESDELESLPDEDDELSLLLLELESSVVLACKDKLALTKYVFTQSIQQMKHCYN